MKVGLACSYGGHLTSLHALEDAYRERDTFLITYRGGQTPKRFNRVYFVRRIGYNPFNMLLGVIKILGIIVREKPSIALSTGAEIALPFLLISKMLGCKTIYIESVSRTTNLSRTGILLLGRVDQFLVQWPKLAQKYPGKVKYEGRLL